MSAMPRLFGTDGVRGVANLDLTPDLALTLGRAAGAVLHANAGAVVVGRDTRVSGPMLEGGLVAGLCSSGVDVLAVGIMPSPAVSFLTSDEGADAGAMISASHNPVEDNGIKFFSSLGFKLSSEVEESIEARMQDPPKEPLYSGVDVGTVRGVSGASRRYADRLLSSTEGSLQGLKLALDCAYGAAWEIGPSVFRAAGADVVALHDRPDGRRINVDCGSTSLGTLREAVLSSGSNLGLALDGDADRVLAVDERGEVVDGDRILAMTALSMQANRELEGDVVVATVMSNLGMSRALQARGIEVVHAPVGDRYVVDTMIERGAVLGGEQSGHIVFARHAKTGDGLLAGLQVASAVRAAGGSLHELAHIYEPFPQVLLNVRVRSKEELDGAGPLWEEVAALEESLGEDGRVLLRASGTEPVVRVMVEAVDEATARVTAERIATSVRHHMR
jgi:phosphoglucosamine mutase